MRALIKKAIFTALLPIAAGIAINAAAVMKGASDMVLFGGSLGSVPFPHQRHQEQLSDCAVCHNLFPQAPGSIQQLHGQHQLKKKEVMNQCTQCHKQVALSGKKSGPIKCKECHRKV